MLPRVHSSIAGGSRHTSTASDIPAVHTDTHAAPPCQTLLTLELLPFNFGHVRKGGQPHVDMCGRGTSHLLSDPALVNCRAVCGSPPHATWHTLFKTVQHHFNLVLVSHLHEHSECVTPLHNPAHGCHPSAHPTHAWGFTGNTKFSAVGWSTYSSKDQSAQQVSELRVLKHMHHVQLRVAGTGHDCVREPRENATS